MRLTKEQYEDPENAKRFACNKCWSHYGDYITSCGNVYCGWCLSFMNNSFGCETCNKLVNDACDHVDSCHTRFGLRMFYNLRVKCAHTDWCTETTSVEIMQRHHFLCEQRQQSLTAKPSEYQKTLVIIKPYGVQFIDLILARFENQFLRVVRRKRLIATPQQIRDHCVGMEHKKYVLDLMEYMASGPMEVLVLEGLRAVETVRLMIGSQNCAETIRCVFHTGVEYKNVIHASCSPKEVEREIAIWFSV